LKYIRYYLLLLLFFQRISYSQIPDDNPERTKTNLEIFEENILVQLEKYFYYPGLNRDLPFVFSVNHIQGGGDLKRSENETRFINGIIKKAAQNDKLSFSFTDNPDRVKLDSNYNIVLLQIYSLETKYKGFKKNRFLGDKTLERNIKVKIGITINSSDDIFRLNDYIISDYTDEVSYDDYNRLESSKYEFTKGTAPEISFFERIIVPAALITVSAAVIILFFMVRTK